MASTQVNPTRMELTRLKKKLVTATRGHKLLKDKQDEMARQFMIYIRRNKELREQIEELLSGAMCKMALAAAEMGSSALEEALLVSSGSGGAEKLRRSIMSIEVPYLKWSGSAERADSGAVALPYGFAFTSEHLDSAVLLMDELMPKLCELASVEKTCDMLADEMERTRRRVNALEYVMIPEMKANIKYISMKLADNELGNLTRLMKVKELMATQELE